MGGLPEVVAPKSTIEEIYARLIEIGRNAYNISHRTIWVVEDPYNDQATLNDICYSTTVKHLDMFPYSILHLTTYSLAFYTNKEAAIEEANRRLTTHHK